MNRTYRLCVSALVTVLVCMSAPASAQWSSDPAQNLVLADRPGGEHVQPKIVPRADGGYYVSRLDNADGGYDVWLQRIDARGLEQWGTDGIRVVDRSFTSTQDYGLDVDADDNAVLAYRVQSPGQPVRIAINRISSQGVEAWTSPGVIVSTGGNDATSPRVAATHDGGVVVAWSELGAIRAQKLDANGEPLWSGGITLAPTAGNFLLADLRAATDGDAIVSWQAQLSANNRQLWAQKLDAASGASLWAADHVKILDNSAGAMQFGYFPTFQHDGAGGAVFGQYVLSGVGALVRVQRVTAGGALAFAQNGVNVSTNTTRRQYLTATTHVPATGQTYVVWRETDATQSQVGVYAQRLDASGIRQWGDEGRMLRPLAGFDKSQLQALPISGGVVFAWVENTQPSPQPIVATRLDDAGNAVWPSAMAAIKTGGSSTARLASARGAQGDYAFVWQDRTPGADAILKAQDLGASGLLGDRVFTDGFD